MQTKYPHRVILVLVLLTLIVAGVFYVVASSKDAAFTQNTSEYGLAAGAATQPTTQSSGMQVPVNDYPNLLPEPPWYKKIWNFFF
jgi:hypothetical protein